MKELNISPTSNMKKCKLCSYDQLNSMLQNFSGLCLPHCNTRSLVKNLPKLTDMLELFPKLPDVICISETKLKENKH